MADPAWFIQGKWLEYCSCDYGCPCESMANPTQGTCDGVVAMHIDEGYFGDVRLDNLNIVATFYFPRAIHHGSGQMQPILDQHSTPEQRDAIFKIMSGEGQPVGSVFQIFSVIVEKLHDPQFLPITFEWDIERRIVTVLPEGWTFYECEVAAGTAKGTGAIKFDFANRHSSLAPFAFNAQGMAYSYKVAKQRLGTRV